MNVRRNLFSPKMVKFLQHLLVVALVTLTTALPEQVPVGGISRVFRKDDGLGNYQFAYNERVGSSGTFRSESGDKSGAKIGSYGVKDDKGNARVVSYVADENGFRAQIKATDGSDSSASDSSGSPRSVSVTNAKVVEVAPVKYHVKHAPVFHYYAGGAVGQSSPTSLRLSLRKNEKGQRKPVETVLSGTSDPSYYAPDVSDEEETKGASSVPYIKEEGILRKIPSVATPQYPGEPLDQAVASGPSLYSQGQPQSIAYSAEWPTSDQIRNLGRHIAPGGAIQYVPSPQHGRQASGKVLHAIGQGQDIRKVDVEYIPRGQQPQYSWTVHPVIKNFELPQLPFLRPHTHYVSSTWPNSGQVNIENSGSISSTGDSDKKDDQRVDMYKYHSVLGSPLHFLQDTDRRPMTVFHHYGLNQQLVPLRNQTLQIGETPTKRFGQYSGGWSSSDTWPNYQGHPFAFPKIVKIPVVYTSSLPASTWGQSAVESSKPAMGWSNSNQDTSISNDKTPSEGPSGRSWSSVPAWW